MRARLDIILRGLAGIYLVLLIAAVIAYKGAFVEVVTLDPFFGIYGIVVVTYILSRFVISLFYRSHRDAGLEPHIAVVMPAFNEEAAIATSIEAILALEYPEDKLDVVVVNDGSTDGTAAEMDVVEAAARGRVTTIHFPENRGKRAAMAAGIRTTTADIVAFVDSDSVLEPGALRALAQGFADDRVGAVCGHADVLNVGESLLTRMQAVRYFVAFKVIKAAESVFSAVTCCSGCFAAYRRSAIAPHLDEWEHQTFLGAPATFGDDRSLTNYVLRDWRVTYEASAVSHTIVPATFKQFLVQQVRWKRSWTRESLIVGRFVWRKHPAAAAATYVGVILPLLAPLAALRALLYQPLVAGGGLPILYVLGIYAVALIYGLYYALRHQRYDTMWIWGVVFVFFYLAFLVWQTYYAMLTANRTTWGTRPSTA
ncbi:MAG: hyaluronan synthase [Solirubrobacteraceae bacterium]|nr:hyaluronan synthase [Solirubrobacteraceae bacterium]